MTSLKFILLFLFLAAWTGYFYAMYQYFSIKKIVTKKSAVLGNFFLEVLLYAPFIPIDIKNGEWADDIKKNKISRKVENRNKVLLFMYSIFVLVLLVVFIVESLSSHSL